MGNLCGEMCNKVIKSGYIFCAEIFENQFNKLVTELYL